MRFARAARSMLALTGLLVLVTAYLAAGIPRFLDHRYDASADRWVHDAGSDVIRVNVLGQRGPIPGGPLPSVRALGELTDRVHRLVPPRLAQVTGPIDVGMSTKLIMLPHPRSSTSLPGAMYVGYDPGIASRIRYVAGNAPVNHAPPDTSADAPPPPIQVGMAAKAASELNLHVGDVLAPAARLPGGWMAEIQISGLYEPVAAQDPYWQERPFNLATQPVQTGQDSTVYATSTVLDDGGYQALYQSIRPLDYTWHLPVATGRITAANARGIADAVARYQVSAGSLEVPGMVMSVNTGLGTSLSAFADQLHTTQVLLALAQGGLDAVALGVLLLCCGVLLERLRTALSATLARGAAIWQLSLGVAGDLALVVVPAAVLGALLAFVSVPGPFVPASVLQPAIVAVLATVLPGLLAAWTHRRPLQTSRGDLSAGGVNPRRLVAEIMVVVIAVAGVVTLRVRGLGGGVNPLLAGLPVLLGAAVGLAVLRLYPYPLRVVSRLAGRSRAIVSFLGLTQASRQRAGSVLPALILLVATAVAAFSATVDSSIKHAQDAGAWHLVGADASLSAGNIGPDGIAQVAKLPGVQGVVPIVVVPSLSVTGSSAPITVVAVDLNAYRALVKGLPIDVPPVPAAVSGEPPPALVSPSLAHQVGAQTSLSLPDGETVPIRPVGTISRFPTVDPGAKIVVVPHAVLTGPSSYASTIFVRGTGLDPKALVRAAVPASTSWQVIAETEAGLHRRLTGAPLVGVLREGFGYGALLLGGYGALAVLMALVVSAHARGRTVAYLRTLGLSGRQLGGLAFVELGPVVLCAIAAGWALGLALPAIVGPSLNLSPYTAGFPVPTRLLEPQTAALLGGGLLLVVGVAVLIDATVNARGRVTGLLRIGDQ